jgi:hypothetical protein
MYCERCLDYLLNHQQSLSFLQPEQYYEKEFSRAAKISCIFTGLQKKRLMVFQFIRPNLIKMMVKKKFVLSSLLVIVLTACILSTGCTSSQSAPTPSQSTSPVVTTPAQSLSPTTTPEALVTTLAPTAVPTTVVTTTGTPANGGLTVTVNSAVKKTALGQFKPKPGMIFLVLDVTIQNNDKNNDFDYTAASFALSDNLNTNRRPPLGKFAYGLDNQLISGMIPLKSKITGQIVFGVTDGSNSYKLSVSDSTGTVLTSLDNINAP